MGVGLRAAGTVQGISNRACKRDVGIARRGADALGTRERGPCWAAVIGGNCLGVGLCTAAAIEGIACGTSDGWDRYCADSLRGGRRGNGH